MTHPEHEADSHHLDMRALVRSARWGIEIEAEIKTSKVLPKMRELAQANFESHMMGLLDATSDDARRELQLSARSFKNVLDFLDEVETLGREAVEQLAAQSEVDAAALEQPDT